MGQLHLIRSATEYDTSTYYERKTEVWVFGDVGGYGELRTAIETASASATAVRPPTGGRASNSMRLCILPAAKAPTRAPRLKLVERIVFFRREPEMELVIYGNAPGYRWLAACLQTAATKYRDDPSEHLHVDDCSDRAVVPRSVSLNIRGALSRWSRKCLDQYAALVFDRQRTYFPAGNDYLSKETFPYEEPMGGKWPFVLR